MTLSFNVLGNLGHLGNQMFQYSFIKSMAIKHDVDFMIPHKQSFKKLNRSLSTLDDCFDLNCSRGISNYPQINEKYFEFDSDLYENAPKNDIDFIGYFQSEKYFEHIEDEIRKDFKFKSYIQEVSDNFFLDTFDNSEVISIHIRRGDYVNNPNHPTQSLEYYEKALSHFDENIPVIIFSDDSAWCKQQTIFDDDRFLVSETEDAAIDLCLMSKCSYHIIANSSFSWWGSYLSRSKKTIAPKNWFGGNSINHNTKDLYRNEWICIN